MEYPVCLADSCVGTLYVCPRGEETELRAVCRGTEKGLYRLYVQGNRGEVLLGVTEDGGLRRCFSRELLAPAGELRRGVLRPCGGEAPERRGFLSRLPEMAPIPELFCFASVGQGRVTYLFDGEGRPIMPK